MARSRKSADCSINEIIDHSHKRKTTGCASIEQPDNKRMTCEKRRIVNDDIFLNIDDQHRSISKSVNSTHSNQSRLIDRIIHQLLEQNVLPSDFPIYYRQGSVPQPSQSEPPESHPTSNDEQEEPDSTAPAPPADPDDTDEHVSNTHRHYIRIDKVQHMLLRRSPAI
ncbi:hypothetical protein H4Q26_004464 [Puccinia striiformis f. sp. tritici PST-130]|nr:hypothetical protein H4Q26_004464 [Puccinia striiformis f. sp. tritici PST-130]